jgi:hypothetical protein
MIDFPIGELLGDSTRLPWLERHPRPEGFRCPHRGRTERRLFRQQHHFPDGVTPIDAFGSHE